jgi:hypothetical protein
MKIAVLFCSGCLLLALASLPIGYYTFLRILITLVAVIVTVNEYKKGINLWVVLFGLTAILFNPIVPIYLYDKSIWAPIDALSAILFLGYSFKTHK